MKRLLSALLIAALAATTLFAGKPQDFIEVMMVEVTDILNLINAIPASDTEAIAAQKERAWKVFEQSFDFNVLSRRALGRNYKRFDETQYQDFVKDFTDLLFENYYDRLKDYVIEDIEYPKEVTLAESKVEVQTLVQSRGQKYPIYYRLYEKDGQWRIYDVIIEGVSMISNYRSQFSPIIEDNGPNGLIEKLRSKTAKADIKTP